MNNNEALQTLRRQILKGINLKVNSSPVLSDKEKEDIRKLLNDFTNHVKKISLDFNSFEAKYKNRVENDIVTFNDQSKKLEEYHIDAIKNLTTIHDEQIDKSNDKIHILQSMLKNNIANLSNDYQQNKDILAKSIPYIDQSLEQNINFFNNYYEHYKHIYASTIQTTNEKSDILIEKIHSENSRRTIFLDEEDEALKMQINQEIESLENKINSLDLELKQRQERLKSKVLAESVELNKQIKILTEIKNRNLQTEKDKNQIKLNDLNHQLQLQIAEFNSKTKKTISLFIDRLAELDKIDSQITLEYKQNIETTKRDYLYSHYSTLQELNNYISQERSSSNKLESFALKRANKKLYKLRIKSYHEKLRDIKHDYEVEIHAYDEKYQLDSNKISLERDLAEVNKNHEVEISNLELETKKSNLKLLNDFMNQQEYLRSLKINDNFNKEASNKRVISLKNVEHLQRRIEYMTVKYNINIANIRAKLNNLHNDLDKINSMQDLRHNKNDDKYTTSTKLIRIITMLDLDKNKLLNDYNKAQINHRINLATLISLKQKRLNEAKSNFIDLERDIKENLESYAFQLDSNKYKYKIDTHNWYKRYGIQNETNQFSRKKALLDLRNERRQFRFNALKCMEIGKLYFDILSNSITFGNNLLEIFRGKILLYDAATTTLAVKLIDILGQYQRNMFLEFSEVENDLIENKINEITQYKYNDLLTENKESFNTKTQEINNNIKLLVEAINKYRKTANEYSEAYYANLDKLKSYKKQYSYFNLLLNKDYLSLKKENEKLKAKIKEINSKQTDAENYIVSNRNLSYQLEKKYRNSLKAVENNKKRDYKSYYDLIVKTSKIKDRMVRKMTKLYSSTSTIAGGVAFSKHSESIYEISRKHTIDTFTKYKLIFEAFKNENENDFRKNYKRIIHQFKLRNYALNREKAKRLKTLAFKNNNKNEIVRNSILEYQSKLKVLNTNNSNTISKINAEYTRYTKDENATFKDLTKKFHEETWAVTNNISYLRNEANSYIKNLEYNFKDDIDKLILKHRENSKSINQENAIYINNKKHYLETIVLNEKKNIAEIEDNGKEEVRKILAHIEENNKNNQIIKKKYKKDKIRIITTNTNRLLQSRILHNKHIKLLNKGGKVE